MTCGTCKHYFPPHWDPAGMCIHPKSEQVLLAEPTPCSKYEADPIAIEAAHQAAVREAARPKSGLEVWLSEQTMMRLQPRQERDYHDR